MLLYPGLSTLLFDRCVSVFYNVNKYYILYAVDMVTSGENLEYFLIG